MNNPTIDAGLETEQLTIPFSRKHHGGNASTSPRLRKTLLFLADGLWKTTLEIQMETNSVAVSADIGDLRKSGHNISCEHSHTTVNGRKVYRYRWDK